MTWLRLLSLVMIIIGTLELWVVFVEKKRALDILYKISLLPLMFGENRRELYSHILATSGLIKVLVGIGLLMADLLGYI